MPRHLPLLEPSNPACKGCPALCCYDLSLPIPAPETAADVHALRWRLHFDTVYIYIQQGQWYMKMLGRCTYLGEDHMCTIYERRPQQCRDHEPPYCQRYMQPHDVLLTSPEELDAYLARHAETPA